MTGLPAVCSPQPLAALPRLSPAAAAALDTDPTEVLARWFANLGATTRMRYRASLVSFHRWSTGDPCPRPEDAMRLLCDAGRVGARNLAVGWRDHLLQQGKSTATAAAAMSSLASLVTACRLCGVVDWHLEKLAPKVEPREDRSGPPRHEVEQLVDYLKEATDRFAVRDLAVVRLLHGAALRRNEVVSLRRCDVQLDHADGPRVFTRRKGHRERQPMTIGTLAARSLRAWLEVRGDISPDGWVFTRVHAATGHDGPISGEAVRQMLRSRAAQAGLRSTVRPHGLRHSAATFTARNGTLAGLKALGGWSTLTSPARYLDDSCRDRQKALAVVEV